ncbi:MAG: NADH-quinone oxidoreductase subunit C, partial [Thermoplasmata archaeon]|nr:NADH-quinone oxidoreductase subunit C [Thermoplasmata archaeon]
MTAEDLSKQLKEQYPDIEAIEIQRPARMWVTIQPKDLIEVSTYLKDTLNFDALTSLSGVDRRTNLEVVYMLWSTEHKVVILLRVPLPKESPSLRSVTGLWSAADWHERETSEMFGIDFEGHP